MTYALVVALAVYLSVLGLMLLIGVIYRLMAVRDHEVQEAARIIFIAPVWPLLVIPGLSRLWRETGWGKHD